MDRWDLLALLGIVCLGGGLALLAPWLGIAVAGLVLLVLGVAGAVSTERAARTAQAETKTRGGR